YCGFLTCTSAGSGGLFKQFGSSLAWFLRSWRSLGLHLLPPSDLQAAFESQNIRGVTPLDRAGNCGCRLETEVIYGQETMRVGRGRQSFDARISRSGMGRAGPR